MMIMMIKGWGVGRHDPFFSPVCLSPLMGKGVQVNRVGRWGGRF